MARAPRSRPVAVPVEPHVRLEESWDEPAVCTLTPASDAELLQGAWLAVQGRRKAELLVRGNRLTVHFADGEIYMGTFTLHADGRPGTIDVLVEEGPPRYRGRTALGIYELDRDYLVWCTASPGRLGRPLTFHERDPDELALLFHREHTLGRR